MDIIFLTVIIYIAGIVLWAGLIFLCVAFILFGFELTNYLWEKETSDDDRYRT